jgi:predicted RNA-binding protein with TRAM domain
MEISDRLHCLFSATIEEQDGTYLVELPERELELGALEGGETYRVALLPMSEETTASAETEQDADAETFDTDRPEPPVEEGETRTVEIEDIGSQGDGITRVERGYVIIVPDTERGERVRIEITDVQENVSFAEVVERLSYYE